MGTRLKGQEVEVRVIRAGSIEQSLTDVVSFEFSPKLEIKTQGYLGETTDRHDDVYAGCTGKMTLHLEGSKAQKFVRDVIDRARRRITTFKVNILATVSFPDGETQRVLFPDCKFGNPPTSLGGRSDYVSMTLDFACDDYKVLD